MDRRDFMKLAAATPVAMVISAVGLALPTVDIATTDPYAGKRGFGYISVIIPTFCQMLNPRCKIEAARYTNNDEYYELLFNKPLTPLGARYAAHQIMDVDSGKLLKSRYPDEYMDLWWLDWEDITPQFKSSAQRRAS